MACGCTLADTLKCALHLHLARLIQVAAIDHDNIMQMPNSCRRFNFPIGSCRVSWFAMAASLRGVWEDWVANPLIVQRVQAQNSVRNLVATDGNTIATQDRHHALLNEDLVVPVLKRMSDECSLIVNSVDDFATQIICFTYRVFEGKTLNEEDAFNVEFEYPSDVDDMKVLAMGLTRCVAFVRKVFLKPNIPREPWVSNSCLHRSSCMRATMIRYFDSPLRACQIYPAGPSSDEDV